MFLSNVERGLINRVDFLEKDKNNESHEEDFSKRIFEAIKKRRTAINRKSKELSADYPKLSLSTDKVLESFEAEIQGIENSITTTEFITKTEVDSIILDILSEQEVGDYNLNDLGNELASLHSGKESLLAIPRFSFWQRETIKKISNKADELLEKPFAAEVLLLAFRESPSGFGRLLPYLLKSEKHLKSVLSEMLTKLKEEEFNLFLGLVKKHDTNLALELRKNYINYVLGENDMNPFLKLKKNSQCLKDLPKQEIIQFYKKALTLCRKQLDITIFFRNVMEGKSRLFQNKELIEVAKDKFIEILKNKTEVEFFRSTRYITELISCQIILAKEAGLFYEQALKSSTRQSYRNALDFKSAIKQTPALKNNKTLLNVVQDLWLKVLARNRYEIYSVILDTKSMINEGIIPRGDSFRFYKVAIKNVGYLGLLDFLDDLERNRSKYSDIDPLLNLAKDRLSKLCQEDEVDFDDLYYEDTDEGMLTNFKRIIAYLKHVPTETNLQEQIDSAAKFVNKCSIDATNSFVAEVEQISSGKTKETLKTVIKARKIALERAALATWQNDQEYSKDEFTVREKTKDRRLLKDPSLKDLGYLPELENWVEEIITPKKIKGIAKNNISILKLGWFEAMWKSSRAITPEHEIRRIKVLYGIKALRNCYFAKLQPSKENIQNQLERLLALQTCIGEIPFLKNRNRPLSFLAHGEIRKSKYERFFFEKHKFGNRLVIGGIEKQREDEPEKHREISFSRPDIYEKDPQKLSQNLKETKESFLLALKKSGDVIFDGHGGYDVNKDMEAISLKDGQIGSQKTSLDYSQEIVNNKKITSLEFAKALKEQYPDGKINAVFIGIEEFGQIGATDVYGGFFNDVLDLSKASSQNPTTFGSMIEKEILGFSDMSIYMPPDPDLEAALDRYIAASKAEDENSMMTAKKEIQIIFSSKNFFTFASCFSSNFIREVMEHLGATEGAKHFATKELARESGLS